MALGGVLGAALNPATSRRYGLFIDGLDVLKEPTTAGNGYGVDVATITLDEAGPGGVSGLEFTIDDPRGAVAIGDAAVVRFVDHTAALGLGTGAVLFLGWIEDYQATPWGVGRRIVVKCIGIEAILDWAYLPTPLTLASGMNVIAAAQAIVVACVGIAGTPLRFGGVAGSSPTTLNPFPGPLVDHGVTTLPAAITIAAGSMRRALLSLWDAVAATGLVTAPGFGESLTWQLTVDFYGSLRAHAAFIARDGAMQSTDAGDWDELLLNSTAGTARPSGTEYGVTSSAARGAWVRGTGAGATFVGDGSGKPGPVATIGDSTITTDAGARAAAAAYLNRRGMTRHGRVTAEGSQSIVGSLSGRRSGGSVLTLTDAQLGITLAGFAIDKLTKTFAATGEETWTVEFGGTGELAASGYLRALTETTRL